MSLNHSLYIPTLTIITISMERNSFSFSHNVKIFKVKQKVNYIS